MGMLKSLKEALKPEAPIMLPMYNLGYIPKVKKFYEVPPVVSNENISVEFRFLVTAGRRHGRFRILRRGYEKG